MSGEILAGGEGACPKDFAACLSQLAAVQARRRDADLVRQLTDAWRLCGVPNDPR